MGAGKSKAKKEVAAAVPRQARGIHLAAAAAATSVKRKGRMDRRTAVAAAAAAAAATIRGFARITADGGVSVTTAIVVFVLGRAEWNQRRNNTTASHINSV